MANYQTGFLQALSLTSSSMSGLLRDIREPDFEDKLRLQTKVAEESQMRLMDKTQSQQMEMAEQSQGFALERMDQQHTNAIDYMKKNYGAGLQNFKDQKEFSQGLEKEWQEWQLEFSSKVKDKNFQWMEDNQKKVQQYRAKEARWARDNQRELIEGSFMGNALNGWFGTNEGEASFQGRMTKKMQKNQQPNQKNQYEFETNLGLNRNQDTFEQRLGQNELVKAMTVNTSQDYTDQRQEQNSGVAGYLSNLDMSEQSNRAAAQSLMHISLEASNAQLKTSMMRMNAMNNTLVAGDTPDFDPNKVIAGYDKPKKDGLIFRSYSAENANTLIKGQQNAFGGALSLATLQGGAAVQDKYQGINTSRQKEAIQDLLAVKDQAERLSTQKLKNVDPEQLKQSQQYYKYAIKEVDNLLMTLKS